MQIFSPNCEKGHYPQFLTPTVPWKKTVRSRYKDTAAKLPLHPARPPATLLGDVPLGCTYAEVGEPSLATSPDTSSRSQATIAVQVSNPVRPRGIFFLEI